VDSTSPYDVVREITFSFRAWLPSLINNQSNCYFLRVSALKTRLASRLLKGNFRP